MIIGLVGSKKSGKSTIAEYLVSNHGFHEISFADPLKKLVVELFDLTPEQVHTQNKKESVDPQLQVTPRQLLQTVGTDLFRVTLKRVLPTLSIPYDSIWIAKAYNKILKIILEDPNAKIVISDVRFRNESDMVRDLGGFLIRVTRNNISECFSNIDNHSSETEMLSIATNGSIHNNGTLEDLYTTLDQFTNNFT